MTKAQRVRRDRAIVAAAARALPVPVPYAQIGRALGLSGQRVKELVEELRADRASKTAGAEFSSETYRERNYSASATRRKLRPVRDS